MNAIKKFFTNKFTIASFLVILFYGMCMIGIYFSGYKVVPDKIEDLPIAIVNEDTDSEALAKQLTSEMPFNHIQKNDSLKTAKQKLKNRDVYLVIYIPKDFQSQIKNGESTEIGFYVNEANPMTAVQSMESVANTIGANVRQSIILTRDKEIFTKIELAQLKTELETLIAQNPTNSDSIQADGEEQTEKINTLASSLYKDNISYKIHKINHTKTGMNYTMAPFFISLAFYIGAMIGAMILALAFKEFAGKIGKWKAYGLAELAIIMMSIIAPLIILIVAKQMNHYSMSEYTSLWLNHGFELFAALNINFIFNLLLGQLGIIINVPVMMIQIVSGAGLIPYLILPNFFKFMSNISPTYYAIQSDYNILGDRMNIANNLLLMLVLGLGSIICHLIIVALKKFQTETATI